MEQYMLYLFIKNLLNDMCSYKVTFNDIDMNAADRIGVYIKGGDPSEYRDIRTGRYYNISSRVQLLFQGSMSNEGLFTIMEVASRFRDKFTTMCNVLYPMTEDDLNNLNSKLDGVQYESAELQISLVKLLGEVDFKGKTSQSLPRYSLNMAVYYQAHRVEKEPEEGETPDTEETPSTDTSNT